MTVRRVLVVVLAANLVVVGLKLFVGLRAGSLSERDRAVRRARGGPAARRGVASTEIMYARRHDSGILAADARHTASDVLVTLAVIGGLALVAFPALPARQRSGASRRA